MLTEEVGKITFYQGSVGSALAKESPEKTRFQGYEGITRLSQH